MPLPNFIVFGTRKAGTSSLYHYLSQHPEIYMSSVKSGRYFLYDPDQPNSGKRIPIKTLAAYENLFEGAVARNAKAIGEASPAYMYSPHASRSIKQTIPNVRLIASLRNPVDRTYSAYVMDMYRGTNPRKLPLTLDNIERWARPGLYYEHLKHYFDTFEQNQIKIILFEEWVKEPTQMLRDVYGFLGVDDSFLPNLNMRYNTGGIPKNRLIASLITCRNKFIAYKPFVPVGIRSAMNQVIGSNMQKAQPLSAEIRDYLREFFRSDILALQTLLGKDLSAWLDCRELNDQGRHSL